MKSKDLSKLPSYLEIVRKITGIASLNNYLADVLKRQRLAVLGTINLASIIKEAELKHATAGSELRSYLDSH